MPLRVGIDLFLGYLALFVQERSNVVVCCDLQKFLVGDEVGSAVANISDECGLVVDESL